MSDPVLLIEKYDGMAIVTLNRPQAMNALSRELRAALCDCFEELDADPHIRVMILTGAGKAFCAGLDLRELGQQGVGSDAGGGDRRDPVVALGRFSGPVIGAINGAAVTGGFELALACDVLIAATNARFADTHARVGILPGWGLSQKLSRAIGIYRAKEVSLTGNFISAEQAAAWGLVNRVVEADALLDSARQVAADMLSVIPECLRAYKKLIDDGFAMNYGDALRMESDTTRARNAGVSAAEIEARREQVRQRGKAQST